MHKIIKSMAVAIVASVAVVATMSVNLMTGSSDSSKLGQAQAQTQGSTVRLGAAGWEDQQAIAMVAKKFLEKQGHKVELITFSEPGIAHAALTSKNIDILVSLPDFAASDYWDRNYKKLEKISIASYGNYQTIAVPKYMQIDSIAQLNDVRDAVGGRIIGIEPGSGLMRLVDQAVKDYNLDFQVVEGSTSAMAAELQSALDRKEPIVTMLWDTSWMMQKFDVKFLQDPKGVFPLAEGYYFLAPKGFSADNPEVRADLASIFVPTADISEMSAEIADGKTAQQAVDNWWERHASAVERWSVR